VERGTEDRAAEAEAILRDSEERISQADAAPAPADAASERRRSEDTAPPDPSSERGTR
jgi:hypothetical protein